MKTITEDELKNNVGKEIMITRGNTMFPCPVTGVLKKRIGTSFRVDIGIEHYKLKKNDQIKIGRKKYRI